VTTLGPVNIGSPNGSGDYVVPSGNYTPTAAGRYQWIASYTSGDANINADASTACLDANEASVVNQEQPPISTRATSPVTIGNPISDTATLDVPDGTTGDIVFKLYGPFTTAPTSTDCTAAKEITAASSTKMVPDDEDSAGSGNYTSDPYTPTAAGIYNWTATFTPDSGQGIDPSGEIGCGVAAEQSVVNGEAPTTLTLTTQATASVTLGDPISDKATLSGGDNPTGTITFTVFGPDDGDCSGDPAFSSDVDVDGEGDYNSEEFTPSAAGTYRWTAEYSGDENNDAVTSECNAENEESVVSEGGNGGGGGGNNGNNGNNNRNHHNRNHHNRHHRHNRHHNRINNNNNNAANRQYTSERRTVEDTVIKRTIPNKGQLANTGGVPLVGLAFLALAMVGLGVSVLRSAIGRER
jgi:hypothetical protein